MYKMEHKKIKNLRLKQNFITNTITIAGFRVKITIIFLAIKLITRVLAAKFEFNMKNMIIIDLIKL